MESSAKLFGGRLGPANILRCPVFPRQSKKGSSILVFKEKDDERAFVRVQGGSLRAVPAGHRPRQGCPPCPQAMFARPVPLSRPRSSRCRLDRARSRLFSLECVVDRLRRVVRGPRQGAWQPSSFCECQSCAVPATVARQTSQPRRQGSAPRQSRPPPRQGGLPSSFCECQSCAPPGSSAVPVIRPFCKYQNAAPTP